MESGINWTEVGQAAGIILGGLVVGWNIVWGKRKSDGSPPPDRAPSPHEVKEALGELRRVIDRHRELTDDDLSEIKKALDRIEAAQRLQDAMAGIRREFGERGGK